MKSKSKEFTTQIIGAQKSLQSFALKLTANVNDANDLVQDTNLKALHNEEKFADKTNFSGWIFTIMRNTFLNNCRSAKRKNDIFDGTVDIAGINALACTNETLTPDSVYNAKQISQIIEALPDSHRLPFTLHMEGYKYSEIAEKLGMPLNIVKSHILHTRRKLRSLLSDF